MWKSDYRSPGPLSARATKYEGLIYWWISFFWTLHTMVIRVVEFSCGGYKNEKIRKGTYWILKIGVMGRCQKVPKFDFQSQFSMSKLIGIFFIFFTWKIKIINFKNSDFSKFWGSPLVQFSKFNNFLWVCWFLCKNLSNFVSLVLKLHNR